MRQKDDLSNTFYILAFALNVGYSAVFTLLAEIRNTFGYSDTEVGLIAGAPFAAGFLALLALSPLADRGHGARLLQVGFVLSIVATAWMIVAEAFWEWMASRALLGVASGAIRPGIRRYLMVRHPDDVGRRLGTMAAWDIAGWLVGPALASLLSIWWGLRAVFVLETLLLIALLPLAWRAAIPGSPTPIDNAARLLLRKPDMQACIATAVALYVAIGVLEAIWAVYLSDLGANQLFIGITLSFSALPMILIAPFAGSVAQRRGVLLVSTFGLSAALISMLSYGYLTSIWWILLPLVVHCIGDAFTMPANSLAVGYASGEGALAAGQGLLGAVGMIVAGATAFASGAVYEHYGAAGLWVGAAAVMAVCIIFAWFRGAGLRTPRDGSELRAQSG
ncbi:MAG: MFS transporter [Pseudomonadota bacterium]